MTGELFHEGKEMVWDTYHHMMDWTGWMGMEWLGIFLWWLGISLLISVFFIGAYYVHKDAVRRQIPNAEIWVLIVLLFNVLGLITYFILRGNYYTRNQTQEQT